MTIFNQGSTVKTVDGQDLFVEKINKDHVRISLNGGKSFRLSFELVENLLGLR